MHLLQTDGSTARSCSSVHVHNSSVYSYVFNQQVTADTVASVNRTFESEISFVLIGGGDCSNFTLWWLHFWIPEASSNGI